MPVVHSQLPTSAASPFQVWQWSTGPFSYQPQCVWSTPQDSYILGTAPLVLSPLDEKDCVRLKELLALIEAPSWKHPRLFSADWSPDAAKSEMKPPEGWCFFWAVLAGPTVFSSVKVTSCDTYSTHFPQDHPGCTISFTTSVSVNCSLSPCRKITFCCYHWHCEAAQSRFTWAVPI